ncbi:MAG: hypothetical protein ABIU96_10355 [Rhodanobacter sp.]
MATTTCAAATVQRQGASRPVPGCNDKPATAPAFGKCSEVTNRVALQNDADAPGPSTEADLDATARTNLERYFLVIGGPTG